MCTAGDFTVQIELEQKIWDNWIEKQKNDVMFGSMHFKRYLKNLVCLELSKKEICKGFPDAK